MTGWFCSERDCLRDFDGMRYVPKYNRQLCQECEDKNNAQTYARAATMDNGPKRDVVPEPLPEVQQVSNDKDMAKPVETRNTDMVSLVRGGNDTIKPEGVDYVNQSGITRNSPSDSIPTDTKTDEAELL
jgi:hypothetical protein